MWYDDRWSLIAAQLPGRTDNDVKNHWNTKLKRKLRGIGIDPVTHKPFSHLMAEIATLAPPQMAHFAEAALGCFKDEMLHLLSKKRIDFSSTSSPAIGEYLTPPPPPPNPQTSADTNHDGTYNEETIQRIRLGLSRAILQETVVDKGWDSIEIERRDDQKSHSSDLMCEMYAATVDYRYENPSMYGNDGEGSTWSTCIGSAGAAEGHGAVSTGQKLCAEDTGEESDDGKDGSKNDAGVFGSDCVLWDLTDDLMSQIV